MSNPPEKATRRAKEQKYCVMTITPCTHMSGSAKTTGVASTSPNAGEKPASSADHKRKVAGPKGFRARARRAFAYDTRGSAAVEFALGFPILLSVIVGVLEVANFFFISAAVENAVLHASRFGITGGTSGGVTREQRMRDIIAEQTFGRVDMDSVEIETLVYEQFADIGASEPYTDENASGSYDSGEAYVDVNGNGTWDDDISTAGLGGGGDIVLYRISYDANSLTGFGDWALRSINISATVAVRNEPY